MQKECVLKGALDSLEAFHPLIMNNETPKTIAILGDGPNAMLLSLVATTAFPDATIFVTRRTQSKLQAISSIRPNTILPVLESRYSGKSGAEQLRKILRSSLSKVDVIIPTFEIETLSDYQDIVNPDGRVIVWAAGQVGQKDPFRNVGNHKKIHHSYGGKNKMEWSALNLYDALVRANPKQLDVLLRYPYQVISLQDGAGAMNAWLQNKGKYLVDLDGRKTSGKIVFVH